MNAPVRLMSVPRQFWVPRPFSLLVCAIVLGLISILAGTAIYARRRIAAIEYVKSNDGQVEFQPLWPDWLPLPEWMRTVRAIDPATQPTLSLGRLTPLHEARRLHIDGAVDAEGFRPIARFQNLRELVLFGKSSDADFEYIGQCRKLDVIFAPRSSITDDGLRHLKGLRLTELTVSETPVTDEGIRYLADMPLRQLDLEGTRVSDASLPLLVKLPIEELNLSHTRVTLAGLRTLRGSKTLQSLDMYTSEFWHPSLRELEKAGVHVEIERPH